MLSSGCSKINKEALNEVSMTKQPNINRRSERAHKSILNAAAELLDEIGYANMTVQLIASRAGVSNKTIYRWWSNKASVVMEAFADRTAYIVAIPNTGSLREDMRVFLENSFVAHKTMKFGSTMANLVAAIQTDLDLAEAFRERFITRRREAVRQILGQAIARGELRTGIDLEMAIDSIYGPLFYRLLVGHAPLDDKFVASLVNQLLLGIIKES